MSNNPPDETTLLSRAARSDPEAIASLYDQYAPRIYSYIYHRLNDPDVAEDLTAQVFLRMIEALDTERGWHSSFSGWLYRIAHNLVIDYYRRRTRAAYSSLEDSPNLPAIGGDPYYAATMKLENDILLRAVNELTEEQAQVITLRFLEGLSIAEVASAMDNTDGAIKALQYRAVASLRRLVGDVLL